MYCEPNHETSIVCTIYRCYVFLVILVWFTPLHVNIRMVSICDLVFTLHVIRQATQIKRMNACKLRRRDSGRKVGRCFLPKRSSF
jgi:hypothetical protein